MKKLFSLILLALFCKGLMCQHEGIMRYFSSYKFEYIEVEDDKYYADTCIDNFHKFQPQQSVSNNNLGLMNPGNPFIPAIFSQTPKKNDFWFFNNYSTFIKTHDDILYFDTKKPFTRFDFTGGSKSLEMVKFIHTQNITPYFNFVFNYDINNSNGYYLHNASKVNALYLASSYTKRKYQSYFNFIFNKINCEENGGIANFTNFESGDIRPADNNVLMNNASNTMSQLGLQYRHEYRFGSYTIDTIIKENKDTTIKDTALNKIYHGKFSIIHDITADKYYRLYNDVPTSFYANCFYSDSKTNDSTTFQKLENKILMNINFQKDSSENNLRLLAGIKSIAYRYSLDSTFKQNYLSNHITGKIILSTKKTNFSAETNYCFLGSDINDFNISGDLTHLFTENFGLNMNAGYSIEDASIFDQYYSANNFKWKNELKKCGQINGNTNIFWNNIGLSLGANVNVLDNYIVYDRSAMPLQVDQMNIIFDVYANKLFKFWKFRWFTELSYQYISHIAYVRLPEIVAYTNFYFQTTLFHSALLFQTGIDAKFNSNFYGYAYMPATGVFYLQNNKEFGNYPNLSFYITAKIKRFRIFAKLSNFNSNFMTPTYYLLYRIPDNPMSFNFGISWEFYD